MQGRAFLFPGQGSQSVGMLAELAAANPLVEQTFREASDVLGYDLWKLTQEGPAAELDRTEHTQPALLAAGVAIWRCWLAAGGAKPRLMAGHSLGEYTALVCASAIRFEDALPLVRDRGRYMQRAVPDGEGAMAAIIGLSDEAVAAVCAAAAGDRIVECANFNMPEQVVIAGHADAVNRAMKEAKAAGAKRVVPLAVSAPSHCSLMQPAADELRERLAGLEVRAPEVPVLHNVDARAASTPEAVREALVMQLHRPVQWSAVVRALAAQGITHMVECGPGKVLTGLCSRIDSNLSCVALSDPQRFAEALSMEEAA